MSMKSLVYGEIGLSLGRSDVRLRLRETAKKLIDEDQFQPLLDLANTYARSKLLGLVMSMFAFNRANLRRWRLWMSASLPITLVFGAAVMLSDALRWGNLFGLAGAAFLVVIFPSFLGMSMEASISVESEPDVARLRCWLILQALKSGTVPNTWKEMSALMLPTLRPYTDEEYRAKFHKMKRAGKMCAAAGFGLMGLMFVLGATGASFMQDKWVTGSMVVASFALLAPMFRSLWFETYKKPVLYDDPSLIIPDDYGGSLEPTIQQVVDGYESAGTWRGMKLRAALVYYTGPLALWSVDAYPIAGSMVALLVLYLFAASVATPTASNAWSLTLLHLLLPVLLSWTAIDVWRNSGGIKRVKERMRVYREIAKAKSIGEVISKEALLETYEPGSYLKGAKVASREDLIANLYVRSIPRGR